VATFLAASAPAPAHAAACCSSASIGDVGRLLIWEKAAIGTSVAWSNGRGYWATDGAWSALDGAIDNELRTRLWGLVRVSRRHSLSLVLPWVHQHRTAPGIDERGGGVGDVAAGWRFEALEIGERRGAPGVALTLGLVAPSGRAPHDARKPLGTDVTTRGDWQASASVALEWTAYPWFFRIDAGGVYHAPMNRDDLDARQRFGPAMTASATGGLEAAPGVSIALVARALHEAALHIDGEKIDDSERTDLGIGLAASWQFHPRVTIQAGVDTGLFIDGLGQNQPGRITVTTGLRYGIF
jgi:hypothetical protein